MNSVETLLNKMNTMHMPRINDLLKLKRAEKIIKYMPRRKVRRPQPWHYREVILALQ